MIVEAKGSYHEGARVWSGPCGQPQVLKTAALIRSRGRPFSSFKTGRKLPAKRWAIASRWGTEHNHRCPTLLAWSSPDRNLPETDYRLFSRIFLRADVDGVLTEMGHRTDAEVPDDLGGSVPHPEVQIRIGSEILEPGLGAAIGPFGIQPIRNANDVAQLEGVREVNANVAVASLSSGYIKNALPGDDLMDTRHYHELTIYDESVAIPTIQRIATRAGLTVAWPIAGEKVALLTS